MGSPRASSPRITRRLRRHAAAHPRAADYHGALSAGHRREGILAEGRVEGFPRVAGARRGPEERTGSVHHPIVSDTRSLIWVANQNTMTPHVWTSRVPNLHHPDICVFDLDPSAGRSGGVCARRRSRCAIFSRSSACPAGSRHRAPRGFTSSSRSTARLASETSHDSPTAVGHDAGHPRSRTPDAGVQQGRPRRPHLRRYRPQRLQRDLRRCLRGACEARCAGLRAVHAGKSSSAATVGPRNVHAADHARPSSRGR